MIVPTDVHICQTVTHVAEISSSGMLRLLQAFRLWGKQKKKTKTKRKRNRAGELDPENNPEKAVDVKKIMQDK